LLPAQASLHTPQRWGKLTVSLQQGLPVIKANRAAFDSDAHVRLVEQLKTVYAAGGLLKDKLFAEDNFLP
jgi:putative chitobiose transport system substrate-binding protein